MVGKRVRTEVASAAKQVQATRELLQISDAFGLVVFVSPPDRIGHASMAWLINDVVSKSEDRHGLDSALVIETSLGLETESSGATNSFSAFFSISGRKLPDGFAERIANAWELTTGQRARPTERAMFTALGASE